MTDFSVLFETHKDFIYRYLLKLSRDPGVAEELTQETFFRAYINLPKLRQAACLAAWLCQIARNAYFSWYRQQKHTVPLENAEAFVSATQLESHYLQKELGRTALQALDQLPEPYKQVLILSVFAEMSLKDISQLYGKSESWARVTFHRGKQKLLEKMEENYGT